MKNSYSKDNRYESEIKPKSCPACGSKRIAGILYGLPAFSPQLKKEMEEGKIVLGGCCVTEYDPSWKCVDCNAEIYKMRINLIDYVN